MPLDVAALYRAAEASGAAKSATSAFADGLAMSPILKIADEVRAMKAAGRQVHNLTIGDFDPKQFPVPSALRDAVAAAFDAHQTNYPPAVGVPELREAICALYRRELDLDFPVDTVVVGSGARPPIYAAFGALLDPGDAVVYPVPSWNVGYYAYLRQARAIPVVTHPDDGFMPTAEALAPHLGEARVVVINSPQNPSGTVISADQLGAICDAILAENARRRAAGRRPVFLLYDAVYWRLTYGTATHVMPMTLRPEMAAYTVFVDAVSKWWAGTGLRVGWGVAPPWVRARMQSLVGHTGAWAAKPIQLAVADLLRDPARTGDFLSHFRRQLKARLDLLQRGLDDMARDGLPVRALEVQGALYLSAQLRLHGRTTPEGTTLHTDEDVRRYLLEQAGVAVVPFKAFGYPEGSGWVRLSVGSVSEADVSATLAGIRAALERLPA